MNSGFPGYCASLTEVTEVPGKGIWGSYRTYRNSGYCGTGVQNSQKFRAGIKMLYPYPGYLWQGRTELTEVPGTGINVVHNLQKLRVRVWGYYRTRISSGYCGTGVHNSQVPGRYKNAVPVPRVFVALAYRTYTSSGYGYESRT